MITDKTTLAELAAIVSETLRQLSFTRKLVDVCQLRRVWNRLADQQKHQAKNQDEKLDRFPNIFSCPDDGLDERFLSSVTESVRYEKRQNAWRTNVAPHFSINWQENSVACGRFPVILLV